MIELVFVILISGILAAVALPRFVSISDDAHTTKLQAFTGTLNRSVGPAIWSGLLRGEPNAKGSVRAAAANTRYSTIGGLTAGKLVNTSSIGNTTYALGCIDSSISASVKFYLYDENAGVIVY